MDPAGPGWCQARTQGEGFAGGKVEPEDAERHRSGPRDAFELAVGAIARKERTVAELRDWLGARGVEAEEAEAALARLIEVGELDDERFAERYAEDKRTLRGWGPERIRDALTARGIDRGLAEAAAAGEGFAQQAERAAGLLLGRGAEVGSDAGRGRAFAYLARRGYDSELAHDAVRMTERRANGRAA
jgi:regulatory protein